MTDKEKVMSWLEGLSQDDWRQFHSDSEVSNIAKAALALLKEQEQTINALESDLKETLEELANKEKDSMLGMKMTADGITFTAKGDAKQGEQRGLLLGKTMMHEHIEKELLYEKLLTDEVRAVLDRVKRRLISDS